VWCARVQVSTFHDSNKMKPANLSIVIAPNILRPLEETMQSTVGDAAHQLKTVTLLIEKCAELWPKPLQNAYHQYITALIKWNSGDYTADASDLKAWQKDYAVSALPTPTAHRPPLFAC
jgi:hypothetical protein